MHSSLSRRCSGILVSGSLRATLVQTAEMPLRFEYVQSTCPLFALLPKVNTIRFKLNFPLLIVQHVTFPSGQWCMLFAEGIVLCGFRQEGAENKLVG